MHSSLAKSKLLLLLPLLIGGSEAAQALLDRFAPAGYKGAELLDRSRTGSIVPALLFIGVTMLVCAFVARVAAGARDARVSGRLFALAPLVLFAVQEHIEFWVGHGRLAGTVVTDPSFVRGLALQIPFALAAYLAARFLVGLAVEIVERRTLRLTRLSSPSRPSRFYSDPPRMQLAGNARQTRGPPLPNAL